LFADTLASDDPLRAQLLEGQDQKTQEIKKALDDLAGNRTELPDEAVLALCDMINIHATRAAVYGRPDAGRNEDKRGFWIGTPHVIDIELNSAEFTSRSIDRL
jgi:hypothetical protein